MQEKETGEHPPANDQLVWREAAVGSEYLVPYQSCLRPMTKRGSYSTEEPPGNEGWKTTLPVAMLKTGQKHDETCSGFVTPPAPETGTTVPRRRTRSSGRRWPHASSNALRSDIYIHRSSKGIREGTWCENGACRGKNYEKRRIEQCPNDADHGPPQPPVRVT